MVWPFSSKRAEQPQQADVPNTYDATKQPPETSAGDASQGRGIRAILLGPPGAGKGTQAAKLANTYGSCHLTAGKLLKAEKEAGTPAGKKIGQLIDRGELVPDDIVCATIDKSLANDECRDGFILDGFPRNRKQAEMLDSLLEKRGRPLQAAVELKINEEPLMKRIKGRPFQVPSEGTYQELFNPPEQPQRNQVIKEPLTRTPDTEPDQRTVHEHLGQYYKQTDQLVKYYAERGIHKPIDAGQSIDNVNKQLDKIFSNLKHQQQPTRA